jgi:hypothetical protein
MEAGNCRDVVRKLGAMRQAAAASGQPIRVWGILDRDFLSNAEITEREKEGLTVLPCHEVENFFLHPPTLTAVATALGIAVDPERALVNAHDEVAGLWIFQHAASSSDFSQLDLRRVRSNFCQLAWAKFAELGADQVLKEATAPLNSSPAALLIQFSGAIKLSYNAYSSMRASPDFWMHCMGKQALVRLHHAFGFNSEDALERAVAVRWGAQPNLRPSQLEAVSQVFAAL